MSTGKQDLFVVVWEWENKQRQWRPYSPEMTQYIERGKEKGLSVVFLGDVDPTLKTYIINLSDMQQECQISGERVSVRRSFFPQSSPAGQGAVWQWQGDITGDWHVYDMCVQCIIESAWTTGAQSVDLSQTFPLCPYTINFCNLTQINFRTTFSRSIRRIQQAAYPVGKPPRALQPMPPDQGPNIHNDTNRKHGNRDNADPYGTDPKRLGFMDKASNSARECSVCNEEYDEDERCPRVLPCSHSLCSDCIDRLIRQNMKTCPFCRRDFEATSARDIGVNNGLQDVLKLLKEMELKQGDSFKESEVSRAHLSVRDLKEHTKELSSNINARCLKAKEQINGEIKSYADLRDTMVQHSKTIENELLIKLNEAVSKNARRVDYVNEQIKRLESQQTTVESNQTKREDILQRLEQADNFKLAGPLIDDAEICNSEAQIWLQDFSEMMSKNEKTRSGIEKVARNTKDKIHVLQEILDSPLEGEEEVDLIMRTQNSETINSRTGFTRSIRRIQQAAYPVGKPRALQPIPPDQGPNIYNDRNRKHGNRDNADPYGTDPKRRGFMDKVFGRNHGNCTGSSSNSKSSPTHMDNSEYRPSGNSKTGRSNSPVRPNPSPRRAPIPAPRTILPNHQNPPQQHQYPSQTHHHQHQKYESDSQRLISGRSLRSEAGASRFGSDRTLDSDCSSLGGRRPSADTISTYLSDDHNHNSKYQNHDDRTGPGVPRADLMKFESDEEPMEDDVFGVDPEVCEVMRGASSNSSPHTNPSPRIDVQQNYHHAHYGQGFDSPPKPGQTHFKPIQAGGHRSEHDQQLNGCKRKRTGEPTGSHHRPGAVGAEGGPGHDKHYQPHPNQQHRAYPNAHQGSRAPIGPEDRLLVQFTRLVRSPPDEMCSICMWSLQEPSGFSDDDLATGLNDDGVVSLSLCDHRFHLACIRQMVKATPQFLECPNCKTMHGEKMGNQPEGKMKVITLPQNLPGHKGCGTIQITYCINDGMQGPDQPHPGRPYRAIGFPRIAYLPNNEKGKKILKLLQEAWRRRLIFTIGTSVTTGIQDAVTWNEIHHKTEWNNNLGHGYPDPNYLDNVLMELAAHGVSETTLV